MSGQAVPEYRRAADVIKSRITPGDIGSLITIPEIQEAAGTKYATARRAADQLTTEGVLHPRQGKGYEVIATPEQAASERVDLEGLYREYREMRRAVGRIEASLIDLYGKLGYEYPRDDDSDGAEAPARHERAGG